jgi:deoxyribodipyrimidine photo-lyase
MKILYWLRSDLRLHDHEVLAALPAHTEALLPVYCFDPATLGPAATWACRGWAPPPAVLARNAGRPAAPVRGFGIWHSLCSWQPYHGTARLARELGPNTVWASAEHPHEETSAEADLAAALGRGVPVRYFEDALLAAPAPAAQIPRPRRFRPLDPGPHRQRLRRRQPARAGCHRLHEQPRPPKRGQLPHPRPAPDWRWGAAWFEHQLIDHDPASNWGNWKYIAGTGTDVRDTAFDVAQQAQRYDPKGRYVRTWLR